MIQFIIAAFAVYRISRMIALEDGFFDVFMWWRKLLFDKLGSTHWITIGFNCPMCISFWVALIASIFLPFSTWTEFGFNWLGLSGIATFLYNLERDSA